MSVRGLSHVDTGRECIKQTTDRQTGYSQCYPTEIYLIGYSLPRLARCDENEASLHSSEIHCVPKKTCDHIFDDKLKQNYPFTKIFGTLITKSIGHRQIYLVSHLTYFVHILYLGKLSRPKYHEFGLKFLIFSMLQY